MLKHQTLNFFAILLLCVQPCIAADYTVENTYKKLIKHYPHMQVPATTLPDSVIAHKALVYKQTKTSAQTLDIYQQTQQTQTAPLIMLIHSGGWQSGTPALMTALAIALVERGYVVATPSYRLSDEAPYPAAVEDLVSAFHWLNNNAAQYNIDSTKIALSGGSAGGQLAALLAYSGGIVDSSDTNSKRFNVQALINIDGLSDFTSPEALPFENNSAKSVTSASKWFGGRYETIPQRWHDASPIFYIDKNAPATLFINSSVPRFRAGRDSAIQKLQQLHIPSEVYQFDDAPHSFWLFQPWLTPTTSVIDDFLTAQFAKTR
ncbi:MULTISPECIES: alpha/beta hydrolase [Pseudoalteromonas]|uniref:Alpha/beta hydrolase n=1 Tax=Pseudoalteromonas neustonica TaxID=1840331 RepID=A0ABY3FCJ1_9GAMM|nr:alpha/beta hydrolase [Pseudoalteromonas neustonica]TVU82669.1 alpha/beta hydrolase [Pseudoalteromonas neustonica]